MTELKSCPFCGGRATIADMPAISWIKCDSCLAAVAFGDIERNRKASIAAWNKRAADGQREDTKKLREMFGYEEV